MASDAKPRAVNSRGANFFQNYGEWDMFSFFSSFLFLRSWFMSRFSFIGLKMLEIWPRFSGWDLLLGSIGAFYAIVVPYTKVEESFNVQVWLIHCLRFTSQIVNSHNSMSVNFCFSFNFGILRVGFPSNL